MKCNCCGFELRPAFQRQRGFAFGFPKICDKCNRAYWNVWEWIKDGLFGGKKKTTKDELKFEDVFENLEIDGPLFICRFCKFKTGSYQLANVHYIGIKEGLRLSASKAREM